MSKFTYTVILLCRTLYTVATACRRWPGMESGGRRSRWRCP